MESKQSLKVIKIGGKVIENERKLNEFLTDFSNISEPKILIHGGGNLATDIAGRLGYETKMVEGRRITDANAMQVITMVYSGLISKNIVAKLQALGCNSIGLCGGDAKSIVSRKREVKDIDYGFVGDITDINTDFIHNLMGNGIVPVFSAISYDETGILLNTNADSIAAEIAIALSRDFEVDLYYCFEKKGVLMDVDDEKSLIEVLDELRYEELKKKKLINAGMIPKLENCYSALEAGVKNIYLGDEHILKTGYLHTVIIK